MPKLGTSSYRYGTLSSVYLASPALARNSASAKKEAKEVYLRERESARAQREAERLQRIQSRSWDPSQGLESPKRSAAAPPPPIQTPSRAGGGEAAGGASSRSSVERSRPRPRATPLF